MIKHKIHEKNSICVSVFVMEKEWYVSCTDIYNTLKWIANGSKSIYFLKYEDRYRHPYTYFMTDVNIVKVGIIFFNKNILSNVKIRLFVVNLTTYKYFHYPIKVSKLSFFQFFFYFRFEKSYEDKMYICFALF